MMRTIPQALPLLLLAALALTSCGGSDLDLSPEARRGREIADESGCAACHGAAGEGVVAPAFVGLAGSQVTLVDGTTVTADRDYLRRSIRDPQAQIVAGYTVQMPSIELTDGQVSALIAYIEELR